MKKANLEHFINHKICFSKRDKLAFAETLIHDFNKLGYKGIVDHRKIGFKKVNNIMIGNFKTAKNIIIVPYDTPKRVFWPNYHFYPQNGELTMKKNFVPYYMPLIIAYLLLLAIVYVFPSWLNLHSQNLLFLVAFIYLIFLFVFIFRGFANHHNVVRTDTSIALAYEIAEELSSTSRKELAFVFSDANTIKMQGSEALEQFLMSISRNPNKIILYCIGKGDHISVAYRKGCRKHAQELIKKHKSKFTVDQKALDNTMSMQLPIEHLNNAMMISSGDIMNGELCVQGLCSNKDTVYDETILDDVKDMMIHYLQ